MKECKILGFGKFTSKDDNEEMLRILIGIKSDKENYKGMMIAPPVYLKYDQLLERQLNSAITNDSIKAKYETTDDIISGKTKVSKIIIEN